MNEQKKSVAVYLPVLSTLSATLVISAFFTHCNFLLHKSSFKIFLEVIETFWELIFCILELMSITVILWGKF
jgi:hypothetical protein